MARSKGEYAESFGQQPRDRRGKWQLHRLVGLVRHLAQRLYVQAVSGVVVHIAVRTTAEAAVPIMVLLRGMFRISG